LLIERPKISLNFIALASKTVCKRAFLDEQ